MRTQAACAESSTSPSFNAVKSREGIVKQTVYSTPALLDESKQETKMQKTQDIACQSEMIWQRTDIFWRVSESKTTRFLWRRQLGLHQVAGQDVDEELAEWTSQKQVRGGQQHDQSWIDVVQRRRESGVAPRQLATAA